MEQGEIFTCTIRTDSAAFDDAPASELAQILRNIADKLENEGPSGFFETILDANGNDVGRWTVKPIN